MVWQYWRDALLWWFPPYRRWREQQIAEALAEGQRRALRTFATYAGEDTARAYAASRGIPYEVGKER